MHTVIACWEHFQCGEASCPAFESTDHRCWMISGTHCRQEVQGTFIEKLEMCLDCQPFLANSTTENLPETLKLVSQQFISFRDLCRVQERRLEETSMELTVGLSEVFDALKRLSDGDPSVRIDEASGIDLISALKHRVNVTAANIAEIVELTHEFAMGLAEHFDVLVRVSRGDLSARVWGSSKLDLMEALKRETNRTIEIVSSEIADRRLAEEQLRKALDELARSNAELEQFAYVASHDLQEPLRMVSSYVELLARRYGGSLDSDADEFIGFAVDGARRMQQLIRDLLSYSRVGTRDCAMAPTDFNSVVDQALQNLCMAVEESGAEVHRSSLPVVRADKSLMVQVFQNLVGNAIKFHGDSLPRVIINHRRTAGQVVFSVRDHGIGIDPRFHDQIFTVFRRLHRTSQYPGTGLGLALCKRIVERHGGQIWVDSAPAEGACFHFSIPGPGAKKNRGE